MALYTIEVVTPQGVLLADISRIATSRHFIVRRNRPEIIELGFDLGEASKLSRSLGLGWRELFARGVNEIRIKRGNRYLVGGQIVYTMPVLSAEGRTLEVRATGFLDLFKDRYMLPTFPGANVRGQTVYTATDIGAVAWDVLTKTQALVNGDFGVTQGTIQASRPLGETYEPLASTIKDILIGLTDRINGIDLEFTYDKKVNVYYPGIGTDKPEVVFSYPGNIQRIAAPEDATQIVNASINRGSGNGLDQQPVETRQDLASQQTYRRREDIDDYPSISVVQTLRDKGDETLRLSASPPLIPDITLNGDREPFLGAFWIGDRIPLRIDDPDFAHLDGQTWRINEINVSVDENDHETIRLKEGYS